MRFRDCDLDLHNFIAALLFTRGRRHAFFPQTQLLSALRSWWNFQLRSTINGGYVNLRAQRRFPRSHRDGHVNVIAIPAKHWMLAHTNNDKEIAGLAAVSS